MIENSKLTIIPQNLHLKNQLSKILQKKIVYYGISISININVFKADKSEIKKDLTAIFAEVLEYFD